MTGWPAYQQVPQCGSFLWLQIREEAKGRKGLALEFPQGEQKGQAAGAEAGERGQLPSGLSASAMSLLLPCCHHSNSHAPSRGAPKACSLLRLPPERGSNAKVKASVMPLSCTDHCRAWESRVWAASV